MAFRKLNVRGVSDETYDLLRSKILAGELTPGERVDVALVSKQLGVSRTPVNDALQRLSAQGLIQIVPRKGTFVTRVTPKDVEELFQLRQALEGKACELAAGKLNPSQVASLVKLNKLLSDDHLSMVDHLRINEEFHKLIAQYSNNRILLKSFVDLHAHMQILFGYFGSGPWQKYSPIIIREHDQIIEALSSNRPRDARNLVEEHIRSAMMRLIPVVQGRATVGEELEMIATNHEDGRRDLP